MNSFFEHFFGRSHDAGADDCDQCQAEPDWYRMGMNPPRRRGHNLSRTDPDAFLDRLVGLRERHATAGSDDKSTGQSIESFLRERATPKDDIQPYQRRIIDSLLYGYQVPRHLFFDPTIGERKPKPPADEDE